MPANAHPRMRKRDELSIITHRQRQRSMRNEQTQFHDAKTTAILVDDRELSKVSQYAIHFNQKCMRKLRARTSSYVTHAQTRV